MAQENPNPEDVLLAVINKVLDFSNEGKQAKAQHILPFVYESIMQYPQLLWNSVEVWKIAKSLLVMHHYDLLDDEEEELKMLHMALVYSQRAIEICESDLETHKESYFNALHTQIMLLSSCPDYYVDTLAELCSKPEMTDEERMIALRMANRILPMMAYNVVVKVDDTFENFNNDDFLEELCNGFELEHPDVTVEQLDNATKIHKMLVHTYLKYFK